MVIVMKNESNTIRNDNHRHSRREVFCEKGVLRNFAKFTGKHLCQSFFKKRDSCTGVFM